MIPSTRIFPRRCRAPSADHLFGADQYGRDVLSRVLYGTRTALARRSSWPTAWRSRSARLGLLAGFLGGATDAVVMRLVDVLLAFPYLLLALIIVAALGPSLTNSMIAIGIVYTPQYARLIRGQVLAMQDDGCSCWPRALVGASPLRMMLRHVLPNSFHPAAGHGDAPGRLGGGGDRRTVVPRASARSRPRPIGARCWRTARAIS